jgi:hypothetical protein
MVIRGGIQVEQNLPIAPAGNHTYPKRNLKKSSRFVNRPAPVSFRNILNKCIIACALVQPRRVNS